MAEFWTFAWALVVAGAASALLFIPLNVAVLGGTPPQDGQTAGSFINLSVQLGGSIAVALLNVVIDRRDAFHSSVLTGAVTLKSPAATEFLHAHSLIQLNEIVQRQSIILSFADANFTIAVLSLLCTPLILLMHKRSRAANLQSQQVGG